MYGLKDFSNRASLNLGLALQFIYISKEEMEAVAEYIKRRGRIAISELAAKSNTFIDLEAKSSTVSLQSGMFCPGWGERGGRWVNACTSV